MLVLITGFVVHAQNTTVSGTVRDKDSKEPLVGVTVRVKGQSGGASTNQNGTFSFSTSAKPPFVLVATYVGYAAVEQQVNSKSTGLIIDLESQAILGGDVVVSASRTPERILESPVSIERMSAASIKEVAAPSFFDAISNMKGVESSLQSLTFKSINTRGFNSNGNTRFNQYIDGMDNQAPGLNFAVGNIVGITDLDIDNVELLPGASSALYGAGGINGTMLMTSKDPFKYQGASFQYKTGLNHVNDASGGTQPFNQVDVRIGKSWNNKFGVKVAFSYLQAKDWYASNYSNYDRISNSVKPGDRNSDPGYDGVNSYGDEVNSNLLGAARSIAAAFNNASPTGYGAFAGIIGASPSYSAALNTLNTTSAYAALRPYTPYLGVMYSLAKGTTSNQTISRTGYNEADLVDYDTKSLKTSGALYYNFTKTIQLVAQANWGTGTSVYTGADRYSLRNFNIGQYKLELKGEDFFVKAYTTQERSGDSYISSILGSYINEKTSPTASQWFPNYTIAYSTAKAQGANDQAAHTAARAFADATRQQPGSAAFETSKQQIINTPISESNPAQGKYGAKFDDKTNLYHYEGMYNFSNAFNNVVEFQVGASSRKFQLRSGGTIFDDLNRPIDINEYGAFGQLGKKFGEVFKLTVAGRYDKSTNFEGRFTPRITGVFTVAKNNNIRLSYQTGYRNPTTQNQYINLAVGGGTQRLIGGLPEFLNRYNLMNEATKGFTEESYRTFVASTIATGTPDPSLLKKYTFDARGVRPESVRAYEIGYKGLLGKNVLIDGYAYYNQYSDFITSVNVYQQSGSSFVKYGVPVNATEDVSSYGAALGIDYILGKYTLNGNVSYNQIGSLPSTYINDFNTPKYRYNIGFSNREIFKNVGYNVTYRWQGKFHWFSSFAAGDVPAFGTFDAQVNLKIPSVQSMIKIGGSNILNKYYITSFGNPAAGALYYLSFAFNP